MYAMEISCAYCHKTFGMDRREHDKHVAQKHARGSYHPHYVGPGETSNVFNCAGCGVGYSDHERLVQHEKDCMKHQ
jgi:hypothetical protein